MPAPKNLGAIRSSRVLDHEGTSSMAQVKVGSTDPELIKRVAALWDNPAWVEFFEQYDPLVHKWCSGYGFDRESADELRQRVWVELARRMPGYQYDPGGSFRGWLRRLCQHRAIDLYHERRDRTFVSLGDDDLLVDGRVARERNDGQSDDDETAAERLLLLRDAHEAQEAVRRRVKPIRWEVFWRVVIEGEPMTETAAALGLKYATAYAAAKHVAGLLREEGRRRRSRLGLPDPPIPEEG